MCSTIFFVRRSPWSGGRAARCPPSPHFAADSSAAAAAVANLFGSDRRSSPASGVDHKKGCGERERERKRPLDTETRLAHGREKKKKKKEQNNNGTNRLDFSPLLSRNYGGADGRTDGCADRHGKAWMGTPGGRADQRQREEELAAGSARSRLPSSGAGGCGQGKTRGRISVISPGSSSEFSRMHGKKIDEQAPANDSVPSVGKHQYYIQDQGVKSKE